MHLAKSFRKRVTKKTPWVYYFLRDTVWDKKTKKRRNVYLAYVGTKPVLPEAKARRIAERIGCTLDDLRAVKGLKIVKDGSRGGGKSG